jgi:beta-carotene ketolase (CrtW type)
MTVLGTWATLLAVGLLSPLASSRDALWALPLAAALTLLYTGLFITAHDAMHGSLSPGRPRLGHAIGTVCTFGYAFMSYDQLRREHLRHHASPGQPGQDPDFHDGTHPALLSWFLNFMRSYVTLRQVALLVLVFWSLLAVWQVPWPNVLLFWALPSLASTLQLFVVGTWWPHRDAGDGPLGEHHARSLDLPTWASFLACYHFGYHLEHHLHPEVPWWRLPQVWRQRRRAALPRPSSEARP